jgi:nitroreductase
MDYASFLDLVKNRRTIRRFKPDSIPDDYIDKIIEAARWAPSGYNSQPWEFVVLKDKKVIATMMQWIDDYWKFSRLAETAREPWMRQTMHPWLDPEADFRHAPAYILLLGDKRTQAGLPMLVRYDEQRRQTIYISSLASAYLYMSLAATTLGLANEWVSAVATPFAHALIKDLLGLPDYLEVYDMMALGYPANRPRPKLMRAKEKMVHRDYCGSDDFRTDEEVKDFIRRTRTWVSANHQRGVDKKMMG